MNEEKTINMRLGGAFFEVPFELLKKVDPSKEIVLWNGTKKKLCEVRRAVKLDGDALLILDIAWLFCNRNRVFFWNKNTREVYMGVF